MARQIIRSSLTPSDVAAILVNSEGIPSAYNPDTEGHSFSKHQADTLSDLRAIMTEVIRLGETEELTCFRDTTEMCQAAVVVLNSACGKHAVKDVSHRPVGTRGVFETQMVSLLVRTAQGDDLEKRLKVQALNAGDMKNALAFGVERMALARMIIEAAPKSFPHPFKVHTFFPVRNFSRGDIAPWFEPIGLDGTALEKPRTF